MVGEVIKKPCMTQKCMLDKNVVARNKTIHDKNKKGTTTSSPDDRETDFF
jgi:hypothetical protein